MPGCAPATRPVARWRQGAVVLSSLAMSAIAGGAVLVLVYGVTPLVSAVTHADRDLLAMVAGVGVIMLVVRAKRAAILLSRQRSVRVVDAYSSMVVGNGLGDLVPLVPCGVALRCFLSERLSGVSIAYAAGVFMLEGTLDGLGLALLSGFLILSMHLPSWLRLLLLATLAQSLLALALPVLVLSARRSRHLASLPEWTARLRSWSGDVGKGLVSVLAQGRGGLLEVVGLSLLVTALAGLQLVLCLSAFGVAPSPGAVLLILVLTLVTGNLPLNIPGSGTVSTAAALQVAGVHGAGVAGFVLLSRFILSSEVTLMGGGTLAWWSATGRLHDLRVGIAFQSLYRTSWWAARRQGQTAGRWLKSVVPLGIRSLATLGPRTRIIALTVCLVIILTLSSPAYALLSGYDSGSEAKPFQRPDVPTTTTQTTPAPTATVH